MKKKVFGTKEFAPKSFNIQIGCERGCKYCWAASNSIKRKQSKDFREWLKPRIRGKKVTKGYRLRKDRYMFPSTHDITSKNVHEYLTVLKKLMAAGNDIIVVTKPELHIVKQLVEELQPWKVEKLVLRFTITSSSDKTIRLWEPNTPLYKERLESLKYAFKHGFKTSVLIEPLLDNSPMKILKDVYRYVPDGIIFGEMNSGVEHINRNGFGNDRELMDEYERLVKYQQTNWEKIEIEARDFEKQINRGTASDGIPFIRGKDLGYTEYGKKDGGKKANPLTIRTKDSGIKEYGKDVRQRGRKGFVLQIRTKDSGETEY